MVEVYINPKFKNESEQLKKRFKDFNFFQLVDSVEFNKVNAKNEIKFANNRLYKNIKLIAN